MNIKSKFKNKKILIIILGVVMLIGTAIFIWQKTLDKKELVACTEEAKVCSDGSAVVRTGPNCEFTECPENNQSSTFDNPYIEPAIVEYLLTQKAFSWETEKDSHRFCVIENLDPEEPLFPFYLWVLCKEFKIENNELKLLSGSSLPAKIDYSNELSFYDINRFSYEIPGDGSQYTEDVKRIFPEKVQERIINFPFIEIKKMIQRIETIAFSNILNWESIKKAVSDCEVKEVFQSHSRSIKVKLKNGEELTATEPKIDDIMKIVEESENKCGKILMGTE